MVMVLAVLAILLFEYERAIRAAQDEGTATPINQQGGRYQPHA
jgi:hypothetical protein